MYKDHQKKVAKKLILKIPAFVLEYKYSKLSYVAKLIYGLTYKLSLKGNENNYSNKYLAEMFNTNENTISKCRKDLIKCKLELKNGRTYSINTSLLKRKVKDNRDIVIPNEVYSADIAHGSKLLWGEYNSFRESSYWAKRETSALRLGCNITSISNWTKILLENNFLEYYELKSGFCCRQKIIVTKNFDGAKHSNLFKIAMKNETTENNKKPLKSINPLRTFISDEVDNIIYSIENVNEFNKEQQNRILKNVFSDLEFKLNENGIKNEVTIKESKEILINSLTDFEKSENIKTIELYLNKYKVNLHQRHCL